MSIITQAAKEVGLKIEGDALPKGSRTVKCFQRLIGAMRAAEAEVQDRMGEAERELNHALQRNLELQERNRVLENKLREQMIRERLGEIESLSVADKTKLIECANSAA